MKNTIKFKTENGILIEGDIIYANTDGICVKLTEPFIGWENYTCFNGPMRVIINSYLKENKNNIIKRLLINTYQKVKIIDEAIDRNIRVYNIYLEELQALQLLEESETKERISSKLEDWYYKNFLFTSTVTGLVATFNEIPEIEKIFSHYKNTGKKLYI